MESLQKEIIQRILQCLKFTHLWNLSLVNKSFHSLLSSPGVADSMMEERWACKRTGSTLIHFLQLARESYLSASGDVICCSRWRLEPDEFYSSSSSSSSLSSSSIPPPKEVQYDDFDEEILPESDDFGEEEGEDVFENNNFVEYKTKIKREGLFVTFEANATNKISLIFLASYLTCDQSFNILITQERIGIVVDGVIVKEVTKRQNPNARLNTSGFQKYWALVMGDVIKFGRGELTNDCLIEWKGEFKKPSHIGFASPLSTSSFKSVETSGVHYLDGGLEDHESEFALNQSDGGCHITSTSWANTQSHSIS